MSFSGYFLLATILVVSVNQSVTGAEINLMDSLEISANSRIKNTIAIIISTEQISEQNIDAFPEANLALAKGYRNCTDLLSEAERKISDVIATTRKTLIEQPQSTADAEQLVKKEFEVAMKELIFVAGVKLFIAQGEALALSSDGAISRLMRASQMGQEGGVDCINGIGITENLVLQAISSNSSQALDAAEAAAKTAFAAVYIEIQNSFKEAVQALKDAQLNPIVPIVENQNSAAIENDPAAEEAVANINQAAKNAIQNGANENLVNELKEVLIIAIGELAKVSADAKATVEGIQNVANTEPMTAKITFFKKTEEYNDNIGRATAKIYLILVKIALKSGNSSNNGDIFNAIGSIETGRNDQDVALQQATDLIMIGLRHKGDSRQFGIDAAFKCLLYGNEAILQSTVEAANIVFNILSKK